MAHVYESKGLIPIFASEQRLRTPLWHTEKLRVGTYRPRLKWPRNGLLRVRPAEQHDEVESDLVGI